MFIGREREMDILERLYQKDKFQMVVLYGRRRVGKTTLITRFIENKPAIFFTAQEAMDAVNLAEFSRKIYRFFGIPENAGAIRDWNSAFEFLAEKAREQRFILAFDEFPYAAAENRSLRSILQNSIDHQLKNTGIFLILCGSQVGFMETEVLGYKSPLFGRRTAQIELGGLDYYDAGKLLEGFSKEEKLTLYGCIGGTPHYLAQIDAEETVEENLKRLYFDIAGYLYNEPLMLLQQELREPATYHSIVTAIANGATRLSEISTKLQTESNRVSRYMDTLLNLHIVKKEYPFGENPEKSRKTRYRLADNCYLFWYRFVFLLRPEIESGNGSVAADHAVFGSPLADYMGKPPFEEICLQFLRRKNKSGQLPFIGTSFGSWWGNDPVKKQQTDIDIIMADRFSKTLLLGECKWRNDLKDRKEIEKLLNKDCLLTEYTNRHYCFFSKAAYSEKAQALSKERPDLHLFTIEDLFM